MSSRNGDATPEEQWMSEIINEAALRMDVISTMADGSSRITPFWKAMWCIQRSQEERELDRRQHDSGAAWMEWLRGRWLEAGAGT